MAKITYTDKVSLAPSGSPDINTWRDNDANEVKNTVNENDTVNTSTSNTLKFDRIQGYTHGTWATPILGGLTLDMSGAVEGGCVVVIWNGSSSPSFTGGTIQSYSGDITEPGTYSVYIHYLNGRVNVNVFNVDGYIEVASMVLMQDDFEGTVIPFVTDSNWTVENPSYGVGIDIKKDDKLILASDGAATITDQTNRVTSKESNDNVIVAVFDLLLSTQAGSSKGNWRCVVGRDFPTDNVVFLGRSSLSGRVNFRVFIGGSAVINEDYTLNCLSGQTMKLAYVNGVSTLSYWNVDEWTQLGTWTGNFVTETGLQFQTWKGDTAGGASTVTIDNFYLTSEDFASKTPS